MEKEFLIPFIKIALPEFDWILSEIEKSGGWLKLPNHLVETIEKFNLQWWKAYEDQKLFNIYQALMFLDIEDLKSIQSQEDVQALTDTIMKESYELITSEEFKDSRPFTEEEKKEIREAIEAFLITLTEDEKREYWRKVAFYWLGFILTFFDFLALMIHGRNMRQLVNAAKEGNDMAYVQAIQIDKSVLNLPYFIRRLQKAHLTGDAGFLDLLSYRMRNPIIKTKIKHRTLYLLFAILDSENMLDMPLKELFDLCQEVKVYGKEYGVGDENSLSKRRNEYKKVQGKRKII